MSMSVSVSVSVSVSMSVSMSVSVSVSVSVSISVSVSVSMSISVSHRSSASFYGDDHLGFKRSIKEMRGEPLRDFKISIGSIPDDPPTVY